jgi:hypothetical protein
MNYVNYVVILVRHSRFVGYTICGMIRINTPDSPIKAYRNKYDINNRHAREARHQVTKKRIECLIHKSANVYAHTRNPEVTSPYNMMMRNKQRTNRLPGASHTIVHKMMRISKSSWLSYNSTHKGCSTTTLSMN